MIVTKKALPRRAILRGIGAALALPLLDAMIPPLAAVTPSAARRVNRLGVFYVPNGVIMDNWTPKTIGAGFELPLTLQPLSSFQDQLLVISGLNGNKRVGGAHAGASTKFLTGLPGKRTTGSDQLEAGISMDQMVAAELGKSTQLASLELATETSELGGSCDVGYSCAYTNTISWKTPTMPLPMEPNPRMVFERLFGDEGSSDPAARRSRMRARRSVLDAVTEKIASLSLRLGPADRAKLGQYTEAVRDIERRIERAEAEAAREVMVPDQPVGIPTSFEEHVKLMYDLQLLAFQSDLTRVVTFMVGREFSGRTYPEIGVPDAHHPISHHQKDPEKIRRLATINRFHVTLFSYFVERLRSTPDGDGTLLDNVTLLYGAGISDGNSHNNFNLPVLLVGGGAGSLRGGQHIRAAEGTPITNLHLALLEKLGVHVDSIGDSTGVFDLSAA